MRPKRFIALACVGASAMAASTAAGGQLRGESHRGSYLVTLAGYQETRIAARGLDGASGACGAAGETQIVRFSTRRPVRVTIGARPPYPTLRLHASAQIQGERAVDEDTSGCGADGWVLDDRPCGPVVKDARLSLVSVGFGGRVVLSGSLVGGSSCATRLARPYPFLVPSDARIDPRALARHDLATITVGGDTNVKDRSPAGIEKRTHVKWTLTLRPAPTAKAR